MTDPYELSLKEVLLGVSRRLDDFLVTHTQLHQQMALQTQRLEQLTESHQVWSSEKALELKTTEAKVEKLEDWQIEVKGQIKLLKWLAGGGALSALALLARLLGIPVP